MTARRDGTVSHYRIERVILWSCLGSAGAAGALKESALERVGRDSLAAKHLCRHRQTGVRYVLLGALHDTTTLLRGGSTALGVLYMPELCSEYIESKT